MDVRVAANGRLILPRQVRDAMGLTGDIKVSLTMDGDVVRLEPLGHRVRRARQLYRDAVTNPRTTDDFLRDRRVKADADEAGVVPRDADGDEGRGGDSGGDRTGGAA